MTTPSACINLLSHLHDKITSFLYGILVQKYRKSIIRGDAIIKKKLLILIFAIAIILVIILTVFMFRSFQSNPLEREYEVPTINTDDSEPNYESVPKVATLVNNTLPLDKLITQSFDIHYIVQRFFRSTTVMSGTLGDIYNGIGIQVLRETETGSLYSVHKIRQGGLLYIFYADFDFPSDVVLEYLPRIIRWFYVQEIRSYSDFSSIEVGSSINDVRNIDPTTQIFKNIYNSRPHPSISLGFHSWHYLNDGILEVVYQQDENEVYVIEQKRFIEGFQIENWGSRISRYDGRILPMDRVR